MDVVGFSAGSPGYASIAHMLGRASPALSLVATWSLCTGIADGTESAASLSVTSCDSLPDGSLFVGYSTGQVARWAVPYPTRFDSAVRSLFMPDIAVPYTSHCRCLWHGGFHWSGVGRVTPSPPPLAGLDLLAVLPPSFQEAEAILTTPSLFSALVTLSNGPAPTSTATQPSAVLAGATDSAARARLAWRDTLALSCSPDGGVVLYRVPRVNAVVAKGGVSTGGAGSYGGVTPVFRWALSSSPLPLPAAFLSVATGVSGGGVGAGKDSPSPASVVVVLPTAVVELPVPSMVWSSTRTGVCVCACVCVCVCACVCACVWVCVFRSWRVKCA